MSGDTEPSLWLVVLVVVLACSSPKPAPTPLRVDRPYAAATACRNDLAVTDSIYGFGSGDSTEIWMHEAVHRRQLSAGCDSVYALWSQDLNAKMEAEAEALCIGMRAAGLPAAKRHTRAVQAAQWWTQFMGRWSFSKYLELFDSWCA